MAELELTLEKIDDNFEKIKLEDEKDEEKFEEIKINGEIAYKCKNCIFHTKYKRSMIVHINRDNPCNERIRELKCLKCEKIFSSLDNYKKHQKKKKPCTINDNKVLMLKNYEEEKINILTEENKNIKTENEKLCDELEQLKNENENLKKNVMPKEIGYIYLLQEREFANSFQNIFKIGKTKNENNKRISQYPKGSVLLLQKICNNCDDLEKELIKIFKERFIQRKDIGTEYFEGDYQEMSDIIYNQK